MAEAVLRLRFSDGSEHLIDAGVAANMLSGYAVGAEFVRSRRILSLVVKYAEELVAGHLSDAAWDRRLLNFVTDTDTLYDLFLASSELEVYGLTLQCAKMTADVVKGGTVEEIRSLLGINGDDLGHSSEQDLLA